MFDVDGVLVDSPHEHAWRVALDQLFETSWTSIRDATHYTSERFTPEVYREAPGSERLHVIGLTVPGDHRDALVEQSDAP